MATATSKWNSGHQGTCFLWSTWGRAGCYVMWCKGNRFFLFTTSPSSRWSLDLPPPKKSLDPGHKRGPQTLSSWPLSAIQIKSKLKELRGFASCQCYPYWVFLPKIASRLCLNQSKRREGGPLRAQTIHGFLQAWEREETSAFPYCTGVTKIYGGDLLGSRHGMTFAIETVTLIWHVLWPGQVRKYGAAH